MDNYALEYATQFSFFKDLDEHTVILTPNRRLSATLHDLYQQHQQEQQKVSWITPLILPVTTWITQLWQNFAPQQFTCPLLLLNTAQEQLLWEKIILQNKENEQLLQITETADLARSAWILLKQWLIDIHHPLFQSAEDYAALQQWAKEFEKICHENNWIDAASLPDVIINHLNSMPSDVNNLHSLINFPKKIFTYGFTEFSPQLTALFNACESKKSVIQHWASGAKCHSHFHGKDKFVHHPSNTAMRITLSDHDLEIQAMARWAKSLTVTHIGCVIPSLDKIRDRVLQIFSEVFAEENTYAIDIQNCPFNISAGKSLAQYPIINTALQILSLHKKNISSESLTHLLATPFLGEAEIERIKRAQYDSQLRFHNKTTVNINAILEQGQPLSLAKYSPFLAKRFRQFFNALEKTPIYLSYAEWAKKFCERLTLLGWPGERSLNSEEYQVVESWLNILAEFSTLDHVAESANFNQALHRLHKMADNAVFQPKTPQAPIQVLGLLEAAAMPFDAVWIAGMDDISWPPQPKPNPFIPKRLQRDLHMPHATAERELTFCNIMTEQFKQSATHVIFSHAEKMDELELQPSPLIRNLAQIDLIDLQLKDYATPSSKIFHSKTMEAFIDNQAPAISAEEKIRGGVNIIKQQALCPFKSFAEWRLHAHPLETPVPGLRAKDRGNVMHKALELAWKKLQDHSTLISLDQPSLNTVVEASIEQALNEMLSSYNECTQYLDLEKKRLQYLIIEWLQIEKNRTPFKVLTHEKTIAWTLGPLALTVRIDRIDELEAGKKLIIDYKTGKNNDIGTWFSDRPEEPQLPLYSLLDPANTCGITFAQIHPGEHCFKGVSQYDIETKGIKLLTDIKKTDAASWGEQLTQWHTTLIRLSHDFYQGKANVDPKDTPQTCTWCELKPLCRINEEIVLS